MNDYTTIKSITGIEKRKEVRELILKQLEIRKRQKKLFLELMLPLEDNIKLLEQVLKSRETISKYVKNSKYVTEYYNEIMEKIKTE